MSEHTRLLSRFDVERLLDMRSCIAAVEDAFRRRGTGEPSPSSMLGLHVTGGGVHAKAAFLNLGRPYVAVKVNANFPGNPAQHDLPTIQGVLTLFDATCGVPLAVMDSMAITTLRTAAASAVAAKHLARDGACVVTIVGSGVQAQAHLASIAAVRSLRRVHIYDIDESKSGRLVTAASPHHGFEIRVARDLRAATRASDIVVTTTPATTPYLDIDDLSPGAFVAAVGADSESKHELWPRLLRGAGVVADDLEQCATIGDLHHAINAGAMTRHEVRATLAEVVAGAKRGRLDDDEIIVFDSTGVAIEDVAAAATVYERALREGAGHTMAFSR